MKGLTAPFLLLTFVFTVASGVKPLQGRTLTISTMTNFPYLAITPKLSESADKSELRITHGLYFGFLVELIDGISKKLGFSYELKVVSDNKYGTVNASGHWNGMIAEVISGKADMALADLTITTKRLEVVDFTMPFKMSGITVLSKKQTSTTAFLWNPIMVWIYFILIFVGLTYLLMKRSQGCPGMIAGPKSTSDDKHRSTRVFACAWSLFVLLSIIMSLGCFAIYLRSRSTKLIDSLESLANQDEVKLGTVVNGSIPKFIRESGIPLHQKLFRKIQSSNLVNTNIQGINRVREGNYAFFISSDAAEFVLNRECSFYQIGGNIVSRGYGIAVRKGSPLKELLNTAILELQEQGTLDEMQSFWWKNHCLRDDNSNNMEYYDQSPVWTVYGYVRCIAGLSALLLIISGLIELVILAKDKFSFSK